MSDDTENGTQLSLDDLDGAVVGQIPEDSRLDSGVPETQRTDELDFIQMTGITRTRPQASPQETAVPTPEELDPRKPISFYEEGVMDVDETATPGQGVFDSAMDAALGSGEVPEDAPASQSVSDLKDLIAELSEGDPAPPQSDMGREDLPDAVVVEEAAVSAVVVEEASVCADEEESAFSLDDALDADTGAGNAPAPQPESVPAAQIAVPSETRLEEAEQLLQALEAQPRDVAQEDAAPEIDLGPPIEPLPPPVPEAVPLPAAAPDLPPGSGYGGAVRENEVPAHGFDEGLPRHEDKRKEGRIEYDYSASPGRRGSRHRRGLKRIVRMAAALVSVIVLCLAGYLLYRGGIERAISTPQEVLEQAVNSIAQGDYDKASQTYLYFAKSHPDHIERASAQFKAATVLLGIGASGQGTPADQHARVLALLEDFVAQNPGDLRLSRAKSITGRMHYELGNYTEAIEILRNPNQQIEDPVATLPILRTLAACYGAVRKYDEAESTYLQAATLNGNVTPDVDFVELGNLCIQRADSTGDVETKRGHQRRAALYWKKATEVPAINPGKRGQLTQQLALLEKEAGVATPEDTELATDAAAAPKVSLESAIPENPTPFLRPDNPQENEPNPLDEGRHLQGGTPSEQ